MEHLFAGIPFASRTHQIDLAVLGACQPSKTVGNRHYELSFGTKFDGYDDGFGYGPGAEIIIQTPSLTYVNWKSDIICPVPTRSNSWWDVQPEEMMYVDLQNHHYRHRIRCIAIEVEEVQWAINLLLK